jgi:hypothetical protein
MRIEKMACSFKESLWRESSRARKSELDRIGIKRTSIERLDGNNKFLIAVNDVDPVELLANGNLNSAALLKAAIKGANVAEEITDKV